MDDAKHNIINKERKNKKNIMKQKNIIIEETDIELSKRKQVTNKSKRLICTIIMTFATILTIIGSIQLYIYHTQGLIATLIKHTSGFYSIKILSPEDAASLTNISSYHTYNILTSLLIGLVLLYLIIMTLFHDIHSTATNALVRYNIENKKSTTRKQDDFFLSRTNLDKKHSDAPIITEEHQ